MTDRTQCKPRGFSLIEAAIVMGVVGLVVGTIWVVSANVNESSRANSFVQQTSLLVQNMRNYYSGRELSSGAGADTLATMFTNTLRARQVFPEDMCGRVCKATNQYTIRHVYNGEARVNIVNSSPYNRYNLNYATVPKRGCLQLITLLSTRSAELGMTSVSVNSGGALTSFPITPTQATTSCSSATNNTLDIVFTITR
jgi:type II secretory pathway pseudopilin PulG